MLLDPPNTQTLDVMHEQPVLPIAMPPTDVFRKGTLNCATLDPTKENLPIQLPATAQIAATDAVEAATDSSNGGAGGGQGTAAQMVMDTSAASLEAGGWCRRWQTLCEVPEYKLRPFLLHSTNSLSTYNHEQPSALASLFIQL